MGQASKEQRRVEGRGCLEGASWRHWGFWSLWGHVQGAPSAGTEGRGEAFRQNTELAMQNRSVPP